MEEEGRSFPVDFEPTPFNPCHYLLESRKFRIISTLAFVLVVGMIVALVLLTQSGSKPAPRGSDSSSNQFLSELKPMLSNESLTALDDPDSPQSQSLRWLLERSNFQAWPFHQQVQRFAMATIYYATGGPSWSNDAGGNTWLTNASECGWFQGYQGDSQGNFCSNNDALVSLDQTFYALKGTITDEIGLDQTFYALKGTIPDEIGLLTSLTYLGLGNNYLTGTVPSQLGSLTALTMLALYSSSFTGTVPSELGSLTALTWLDLSYNAFRGTVPSQLGSLTELQVLRLFSNSFNGTVPSQLGSLTALSQFDLYDNVDLNGTVPAKLCNLGQQTVSIYVDCTPGPQCSCCQCGPRPF